METEEIEKDDGFDTEIEDDSCCWTCGRLLENCICKDVEDEE
jgi:hypothetical protein